MGNKIIENESGVVSVRLDGAFVTNGKHLVEPYINEDNKKRYFGNFMFVKPDETEQTLREAVNIFVAKGVEDSVFEGQYPRWEEDEYGLHLNAQNRVKFFKTIDSSEQIPNNEITDYIYSIEVHLTEHKKGGIFLRVARAIAQKRKASSFQNDLYDDFEQDLEDVAIAEDELPF